MRQATVRSRVIFAVGATAVGAALLAAALAQFARAGGSAGATLRINLVSDVDYVDPALAYYSVSWQLEYATCLKLVNYPDAEGRAGVQLVPEAATALPRVSADGRTYAFHIRAGLRSNLGAELTALNFDAAIHRALYPKMQSPAGPFIRDVEGAEAVLTGKARRASGVRVRGRYDLVVRLTKRSPDFLARLAMPFFCAVPDALPIVPEGVDTVESWGPYYVAERIPNRRLLLLRNRNYRGQRPHQFERIEYRVGVQQDASLRQIQQGEADYAGDGLAPSAYAELAKRYGVNRRRFFVKPTLGLRFLRFNLTRGIFKDDPQLRRAVNYAIDRPEILRQLGAFAGRRTDQLLPVGMPSFRDADLYPLKGADVDAARRLVGERPGRLKAVYSTCNRTACIAITNVLVYNLAQIGIDLEVRACGRVGCSELSSFCNAPDDVELSAWAADYADPQPWLAPADPHADVRFGRTSPLSCVTDGAYARRYARAAGLAGPARLRAFGDLDVETMERDAPIVPIAVIDDRFFVSARTRNVVYNPIYGLDLAALELR